MRDARGREALFTDVVLFEVRCGVCLACVFHCGAVLLSVTVLGGGGREGVGGDCRVVERVLWVFKMRDGMTGVRDVMLVKVVSVWEVRVDVWSCE